MSDTPTLVPGTNPAGTPVADDTDPLAPPDDLGASLLAEFERREKATAAALGKDLGDGPPGGFPSLDDAAKNVTARVDVSQQGTPATTATPEPVTASGSPTGPPAGGDAASEPGRGDSDAASTPGAGGQPAAADETATVLGGAPEEGAGAETAAPAPSGYTWTYHDGQGERTVTFDDAQVQRAIGIATWAESLPPDVQQAIGSIETGQAVAIPRAEFDEFQAWKNQQHRVSRDADLDSLDLDPDVAKILREQRDQIDALKTQQSTQLPGGVDPQYQQHVNAGIERDRAVMATALETYGQQRGLSAQEVEELLGAAVNAQVIPSLVEANTIVNPANGSVLVPADMARVTEEALDWALIRSPALKTRVLAAQQPTGQVRQGAQLPPTAGAGQPAPVIDPVQARKARAGSLATAPSGAAPPIPPQTVQTMSPQQIAEAMARDIENAMKS